MALTMPTFGGGVASPQRRGSELENMIEMIPRLLQMKMMAKQYEEYMKEKLADNVRQADQFNRQLEFSKYKAALDAKQHFRELAKTDWRSAVKGYIDTFGADSPEHASELAKEFRQINLSEHYGKMDKLALAKQEKEHRAEYNNLRENIILTNTAKDGYWHEIGKDGSDIKTKIPYSAVQGTPGYQVFADKLQQLEDGAALGMVMSKNLEGTQYLPEGFTEKHSHYLPVLIEGRSINPITGFTRIGQALPFGPGADYSTDPFHEPILKRDENGNVITMPENMNSPFAEEMIKDPTTSIDFINRYRASRGLPPIEKKDISEEKSIPQEKSATTSVLDYAVDPFGMTRGPAGAGGPGFGDVGRGILSGAGTIGRGIEYGANIPLNALSSILGMDEGLK